MPSASRTCAQPADLAGAAPPPLPLDGLSYRRGARMVGICRTEVGDSLDLLLGELAGLGLCQPDGTLVASLQNLRERLAELTEVGEAVCVDGLATRGQRPGGWANQKVLDDAKRRAHTAPGVALSTIHGDLLWCDGGWPGSCPAVPGPGRRPGRRGAQLPRPMDPPHPDMTEASRHPH